ncbi:uncharacterized protein KY384_007740 [Bacidia gigantensis]|uniref:uncharacterized protein n=1 Tax=Bacidia gigantensis TaxID=2732470 RepID=UPI001D039ABC|nr:uncharacterized protein KY384_007740 [Bacidia gigantensis]KAG8527587.1 hypothetical protein KY384_007740 [Bacidia gigantensis]
MRTPSPHMPTPPPESAPIIAPPHFEFVTTPSPCDSAHYDSSITSHYRGLLRDDQEITKPIAAIESLIALLDASPPSTVSETLALIQSYTSTLKSSIPQPTALSAGTDLFQRYIISTLQSGETKDFGAIRAHLLANSKLFVQRAKGARKSIARIAKRFIQDNTTILTCGSSRVVADVLMAAADDEIAFRVIYVQANTSDGHQLLTQLRKQQVPVAVIPFAALGSSISQAHLAMIGAESVVENGGVISSMGTKQVCLLANCFSRPLYVVAESHKFVRVFPLGPEDLKFKSSVLNFEKSDSQTDEHAAYHTAAAEDLSNFDFTSPELITAIITETGVQTPSAESEIVLNMSVLWSKATRLSPVSLRYASSVRQFSQNFRLSALSEADHSMDDDAKRKTIEEHKDDQLAKQKEGKGHWKRELATSSESAVIADKSETTNLEDDIAALQKETGEALQADHEHGKK